MIERRFVFDPSIYHFTDTKVEKRDPIPLQYFSNALGLLIFNTI